MNDTVFVNRDTNISENENHKIIIHDIYNYTCHKIKPEDEINYIKFQTFKLTPLEENTYLGASQLFKSDTIILNQTSISYYVFKRVEIDTSEFYYFSYFNDCNSFPIGSVKYIGFKIIEDCNQRLGWIKIMFEDVVKIRIFETAID